MPPNQRNPTDPREWIRRARSNLARAKAHRQVPDVVLEDLCFDAQQAVEKAFKALLVSRQHPFPKTHAIAELLGLVEQSGIGVPDAVREAAELTDYAVEARIPGVYEDVVESVQPVRSAVQWRCLRRRRRGGLDSALRSP